MTKNNKKIQINMALNYGSRQEIVHACNYLKKKKLPINQRNINKY